MLRKSYSDTCEKVENGVTVPGTGEIFLSVCKRNARISYSIAYDILLFKESFSNILCNNFILIFFTEIIVGFKFFFFFFHKTILMIACEEKFLKKNVT